MVSARACAYQFMFYSSSGITLFNMRTVQADSCRNSEQIDTLFISVGGQGSGSGWVGGHLELKAKNLHVTVMEYFFCHYFYPSLI